MKISVIESLLKKFYEGETNLQEEQTLREFFQSEQIPDHLESQRPMFTYFNLEKQTTLHDDQFDQRLTRKLGAEPAASPFIRMLPVRSSFLFVAGIAASILLLIGVFIAFQQDVLKKNLVSQVMSPDPELVFADASQALLLVSGNLNNGLKQVATLEKLDKAMNNMQLFNKFYQYQSIIIHPDEAINLSTKSK
jgi:hypothetical protein